MNTTSTHFLRDADFKVLPGKSGQVLCTTLQGISLVLFYVEAGCKFCHEVLPLFKQRLPYTIPDCQFAIVNLTKNPSVAAKSAATISPITHVPHIVMYINGRPFLKYTGKRQFNDIAEFVMQVLSRIQGKKNFSPNTKMEFDDSEVREYSNGAGIPFNIVCDEEKCYLKYGEAYKDKRG